MPMNDAELTDAIMEAHDAIRTLTAGCQKLAGAIENQTQLLVEIKEAVTAEPQEESPIVALLKRLVELSEANAAVLRLALSKPTRGNASHPNRQQRISSVRRCDGQLCVAGSAAAGKCGASGILRG